MCDNGKAHKSYASHFRTHLKDLRVDKNTLIHVAELMQYTLLYTIVGLYVGTFIDSFFYHASLEKKSTPTLIGYICLHMIVDILAIFFIRKLVKLVPFIGEPIGGYTAHCGVLEFEGEIGIGIIFIATQRNLLANVDEVVKRLMDRDRGIFGYSPIKPSSVSVEQSL